MQEVGLVLSVAAVHPTEFVHLKRLNLTRRDKAAPLRAHAIVLSHSRQRDALQQKTTLIMLLILVVSAFCLSNGLLGNPHPHI